MEHARIKREEFFMAMKGGKVYTTADIEALPEGERAELIDGEIFLMASPTLTHQDLLVELIWQIKQYIRSNNGDCRVLPAPFGVYIKKDDHNFVEPDISVICDKEKLDEKGCHGAPDWIIEIVSPSSKQMDYLRKAALYRDAGVREYWIVDSQREMVTVHDANCWDSPVCHSFSEQIQVGIYQNLYIDFPGIAESLIYSAKND